MRALVALVSLTVLLSGCATMHRVTGDPLFAPEPEPVVRGPNVPEPEPTDDDLLEQPPAPREKTSEEDELAPLPAPMSKRKGTKVAAGPK